MDPRAWCRRCQLDALEPLFQNFPQNLVKLQTPKAKSQQLPSDFGEVASISSESLPLDEKDLESVLIDALSSTGLDENSPIVFGPSSGSYLGI